MLRIHIHKLRMFKLLKKLLQKKKLLQVFLGQGYISHFSYFIKNTFLSNWKRQNIMFNNCFYLLVLKYPLNPSFYLELY